MSELGICIEGLSKRYGEGQAAVDALKDTNMSVAPGRWWVLLARRAPVKAPC
jgi:ABC-type lipoprotein export system ATPase subunit